MAKCVGDCRAVPLTKGTDAPFSGQLLTPELAIDLGLRVDFCEKRSVLELDYQSRVFELEMQSEKRLREIDRKEAEAREKEIAPRWYERPIVVSASTFILTLGVVWTASQAIAK